MEIERKFLIAELPHALQAGLSAHLRQGYPVSCPEGEVRLRDADGSCTLTVKSGAGLVRDEREISLDAAQLEALWPATAGRRLEKRRYTIPAGGLRYEIDVYEGDLAGLMVVEVEFPTTEKARAFMPPEWFGREVTGDPAYTNASLSQRGLPQSREDAR